MGLTRLLISADRARSSSCVGALPRPAGRGGPTCSARAPRSSAGWAGRWSRHAVILALIALATGDGNGRPVGVPGDPDRSPCSPCRSATCCAAACTTARRDGRCLLPVAGRRQHRNGARPDHPHPPDAASGLARRGRLHRWTAGRQRQPHRGRPGDRPTGDLAAHVRRGGYRIVGVTPDPYWTPAPAAANWPGSWRAATAEMVVAPVLMEVAGPRVHVSGVLGMPLLRVSAPVFTGVRRVVKEIFDRVASVVAAGVAGTAVAGRSRLLIKLDSKGPVFYRQQRVGKDGKPFTMIKFRTMVVGADVAARRAARWPTRAPGRCSRCAPTRGSPRSAAGCAATRSTSCRSC